jgi:hypothetical protein
MKIPVDELPVWSIDCSFNHTEKGCLLSCSGVCALTCGEKCPYLVETEEVKEGEKTKCR